MSGQILGDLIVGGFGLLSSCLSVILLRQGRRTGRSTDRVLENVANDHSKNLRVEQDERHNENQGLLRTIFRTQLEQGRQINKLFGRVDKLVAVDLDHDERLQTLDERTKPRHAERNPSHE